MNFADIGKLLIKLQYLETLIKFIISLLNKDIKGKKVYRIKDLSARNILDDNTEKTKQTLGQLMIVLKSEIPSFDNEEFEELLAKRNRFIHGFHKEFLSKKEFDEKEVTLFIKELWLLADKYTKIFTGFISLAVKLIGKGKISVEGIDKDEIFFYNYLLKNNSQIDANKNKNKT